MKNIIKIGLVCAATVSVFSSCEDFLTIYPTDKIVGEDFWKTKAHVDETVSGAFSSFASYNVQEKCIIWGGFRSDELVKNEQYTSASNSVNSGLAIPLDNISAMNLLPSNTYNDWSGFYGVINRCNIVLNHAKDVLTEDPEFTEGDYNTARGQMLALRSLCYYYLVRAFRDVPYVTESFEDDTKPSRYAQSPCDSVLECCIADLEEAEKYVLQSGAYGRGQWQNVGYITRDAVHAILCDIYLWRASLNYNSNHSLALSFYEKASEYADKVIAAKNTYYRANYRMDATDDPNDIYHLIKGRVSQYSIFGGEGNSTESIFEVQHFSNSNNHDNTNDALGDYYFRAFNRDYNNSKYDVSRLKASVIFSKYAESQSERDRKVYWQKSDMRYWNNCTGYGADETDQLNINKMLGSSTYIPVDAASVTISLSDNGRKYFGSNWIVYRLTDVMLMKAEAEVELSETDSTRLQVAFDLVDQVNRRSQDEKTAEYLKIEDFKTKDQMEALVLAERERELCFEGKRWFDLVRYCYRHMQGVDVKHILADQGSWPAVYSPMIDLVKRKYDTGGDALKYKLKSEPYLYFPISLGETKINSLLKQNPVYNEEETVHKN